MFFSFFVNLLTAPLDIVYYIKYILSYIYIRIYNSRHAKRFDLYDVNATGDPVKLGFVIPQIEKDLESPLPESQLQNTADEVFIYGVNSKSECLLVRVARGPNQVAEAWIHLRLANGKVYNLAETTGYQQPFEKKCLNFSCGKLQMQYLSPMRKWRIFYCGMLTETSPNQKDAESLFVKFAFIWKASSDVDDLSTHTNPKGLASALARSNWKNPFVPPVKDFIEAVNFYAQSGVIDGTVSIDGGDDYEMYLFGEKMRNMGKVENFSGCKFTNVLGCTPQNGIVFHLGQATTPKMFENYQHGFIVQASGDIDIVKEVDININVSSQDSRKNIKANFLTNTKSIVTGTTLDKPFIYLTREGWYGSLELTFAEFNLDNRKGFGIIMTGEIEKKTSRNMSEPTPVLELPDTIPLTVPFLDPNCSFGEISGGKGSSLGKLTQLSLKNKKFTVPKGIVVTTAAYEEFLTPEINSAVKQLENIAYGNTEGDLKATCNMVSSIVEKSLLPKRICQSIIEDLKDIFGADINSRKFAVRSSATGEDTDAMSAAGQMDTFLGIQGIQEIFLAVKKCWASQFGHIAIEYKRRNGQVLNSPMAVVIQEMVACEVSGVLFTCDPVTNNPSFITITANYGLGETVVSGSVEPDTISLRRKDNGMLELDSVTLGTKHQKIIMQESGGTVTEDLPESSKDQSCLSNEMAMHLGKLAIEIEKFYKSSRDIEWGIVNKEVYMLQSRPVTNAAGETDYEISHEFDSPLRREEEYFSVANVGEVMPGASTPLGMDLVVKMMGIAMKKQAKEKDQVDNFMQSQYYLSGILSFYNHVMMNPVDIINRYGSESPMTKGIQISVFGRILDDPDLLEYALEKEVDPPPMSIKCEIKNYLDLFLHARGIHKEKEQLHNYEMKFLKTKTAKDAFNSLMNACSDFESGPRRHMNCSENSSNWNMYVFRILCYANGKFDDKVYSDFARLLATSSNVESAEVPQAMQDLGFQIQKDIDSKKFKAMTTEEAEKWLQTSSTAASRKFREFLKRHGHRCLKEFDVRTVTWAMDPKPLVKILQNMVGTCSDIGKKKDDEDDKIISELNVPLGFIHKLMLKFVLPHCRKGVGAREMGKSLTIKSFDYLRQGYRHLAKLMVSEGRIPDADLIYFMTVSEIDDLLQTRSPSIISRAIHRRKVNQTLEDYIFPEIMKGRPVPINMQDESSDLYQNIADLTLKGIPVSQGVTKGFARVAISLEEASHLKRGEILITYSTDIGWSPYFPIVSGVVTELGGLISHGAVVSREYGLPCVVGLQGATKMFKTGDYVLLDGKKGILQRLPKPDN